MTNVSTHFMFQGNASAALETYENVFPDFVTEHIETYGDGEHGKPGTIKQA